MNPWKLRSSSCVPARNQLYYFRIYELISHSRTFALGFLRNQVLRPSLFRAKGSAASRSSPGTSRGASSPKSYPDDNLFRRKRSRRGRGSSPQLANNWHSRLVNIQTPEMLDMVTCMHVYGPGSSGNL